MKIQRVYNVQIQILFGNLLRVYCKSGSEYLKRIDTEKCISSVIFNEEVLAYSMNIRGSASADTSLLCFHITRL
jgi:hypothetical protein